MVNTMHDDDSSDIKLEHVTGKGKLEASRAKFLNTVRECLHWFEVLIAFGALGLVILGAVQLIGLVSSVGDPGNMPEFFASFEELLSALLLLIVGVELAIMLILRRPESLLEIMFFVIARKVLIKTEHVYELLLAVIAIAMLFAVKKYLMTNDKKPPAEPQQADTNKTKN